MMSKRMFDSFWTGTYLKLRELCEDPATRPDFIIADFFAEQAARDMKKLFDIQMASVWPQMPFYMAPASYIPGQPGFQMDVVLTSEHASVASRLWNESFFPRVLPDLIKYVLFTKRLRKAAGVTWALPPQLKPDYLVLVNSFFGLEVPKDLPPLIHPVGPLLSEEYPPLDDDLSTFLDQHDRTVYVSLGTHVCLPTEELEKLLSGFVQALDADHINGIIWSVPVKARPNFDLTKTYTLADGSLLNMGDVLSGPHPHWRTLSFAPQRAILAHPNTKLFLTHGGGSSANETLFHGVPVLTIGYYFDQLSNSARLHGAGVGIGLDKSYLTADSIAATIGEIMTDADGSFARNVLRMKRITRTASRRKHLAADLVEEVMYDQELRFEDGVEKRPMHLQTADMRMSMWRAKNWDLWFYSLTGLAIGGVATWWTIREGWKRAPKTIGHLSVLASTLVGAAMEKRWQAWRS